mmetsp:Transcript_14244/g.46490  ORF Transcript_14244/g.46490 Transcript_14244/m.46490 type:complete len:239 (+) Transcript_14244:603-1319(+)
MRHRVASMRRKTTAAPRMSLTDSTSSSLSGKLTPRKRQPKRRAASKSLRPSPTWTTSQGSQRTRSAMRRKASTLSPPSSGDPKAGTAHRTARSRAACGVAEFTNVGTPLSRSSSSSSVAPSTSAALLSAASTRRPYSSAISRPSSRPNALATSRKIVYRVTFFAPASRASVFTLPRAPSPPYADATSTSTRRFTSSLRTNVSSKSSDTALITICKVAAKKGKAQWWWFLAINNNVPPP